MTKKESKLLVIVSIKDGMNCLLSFKQFIKNYKNGNYNILNKMDKIFYCTFKNNNTIKILSLNDFFA